MLFSNQYNRTIYTHLGKAEYSAVDPYQCIKMILFQRPEFKIQITSSENISFSHRTRNDILRILFSHLILRYLFSKKKKRF